MDSRVDDAPLGWYKPSSHSLIVCWRVPSLSAISCCVRPICFLRAFTSVLFHFFQHYTLESYRDNTRFSVNCQWHTFLWLRNNAFFYHHEYTISQSWSSHIPATIAKQIQMPIYESFRIRYCILFMVLELGFKIWKTRMIQESTINDTKFHIKLHFFLLTYRFR